MECNNRFPSFRHFELRSGAVLGHKMRSFGGHPPTLCIRPGALAVSFWLKTWIWQGHHLGSRTARLGKDPKCGDGATAKTET